MCVCVCSECKYTSIIDSLIIDSGVSEVSLINIFLFILKWSNISKPVQPKGKANIVVYIYS